MNTASKAAALAFCLFSIQGAAQTPAFWFQTSYDESAKKHDYSIMLGATESTPVTIECAGTSQEVTLGQTPVTVNLTGTRDGIVKVYGDASKINMLDLKDIRLADIVWDDLINLEHVDISGNKLRSADLSGMSKLVFANLGNNPYSRSGRLTVGGNKPSLQILYINDIDYINADFNPSDYPSLLRLDASNAMSVKSADVSGCPNLQYLDLSGTGIAALDVTSNPRITSLSLADTKISGIDLSNCGILKVLDLSKSTDYVGPKIAELDLSANGTLTKINVAGNELETLDVTGCVVLESIDASRNALTSIDLVAGSFPSFVDLSANNLTFATLPLPPGGSAQYLYAQNPLQMRRRYAAGKPIDLSWALRPGSTVEVQVAAADGSQIAGQYSFTPEGVLTFSEVQPGDVTVSLSDKANFPDAPLVTKPFGVVTEEEAEILSKGISFTLPEGTNGEISMNVGIADATSAKPVTLYADFGDGAKTEFKIESGSLATECNVTGTAGGNKVTLYTDDETVKISAFGISSVPLETLDVTSATGLVDLEVKGCGLEDLNLKENNLLQNLDLSDNNLNELILDTEIPSKIKMNLRTIVAPGNNLYAVTLTNSYTLSYVDLTGNHLYGFPLESASNLKTLLFAGNNCTETTLVFDDCRALTTLDISGNLFQSFPLDTKMPLQTLHLEGNAINIPLLPAAGSYPQYTYAPQRQVEIPAQGCSADLSDQYVEIDGQPTAYEWRVAGSGQPAPEGSVAEFKGTFGFPDAEGPQMYCAITHPAFPDFQGENAIFTSEIKPEAAPDNVLCSFVPAADCTSYVHFIPDFTSTVYVDWTGLGIWLGYEAGVDRVDVERESIGGNTVKVASYLPNQTLRLASLSTDIPAGEQAFESIDLSPLNGIPYLYIYGVCPQEKIQFPADMTQVQELGLHNVGLTSIDLSPLTNLYYLDLTGNNISNLDISGNQKLTNCYVTFNPLETFVYDNPKVWELTAAQCGLTSIDLSKLPAMRQLNLMENDLTELDLSAVNLVQLRIGGNKFNFSTLPVYGASYDYGYWPQQPLEAMSDQGHVDLACTLQSQEKEETSYYWFIGMPTVDETGKVVGDQLRLYTDYTVENGVTTFLKDVKGAVCAMLNPSFPALMLVTDPIDAEAAGTVDLNADGAFAPVRYYDLQGRELKAPAEGGVTITRRGTKTEKQIL